jgi:cysteinyl-tRNA synthetase
MAKSEGNFVTIPDALARWGREALLLFFLSGHWSKPLDFSEEAMEQARSQAAGFREVFRNPVRRAGPDAWSAFADALEDDFNTPAALAVMHGWRDDELLRQALDVFGLASLAEGDEAPVEIVELAEKRRAARAARDFHEADRLRREIEAAGWEARDVADGYQLVPK